MGGILGTCTVQAETRDKRGSREALPHVRLASPVAPTPTLAGSFAHAHTHLYSTRTPLQAQAQAGLAGLGGPGSHFRSSVPPALSCLCGLDSGLVWSLVRRVMVCLFFFLMLPLEPGECAQAEQRSPTSKQQPGPLKVESHAVANQGR